VQRGVPSVVAMRRAVRVDNAHLFTQHLYRHIAETGRADAAVNEARQQLYLADPRGIDWSSPVLYSRLNDGRLWLPRSEAEVPETRRPRIRLTPHRLRRPLPWVPALLALLLLVLGVWPAPGAEVRFDLLVSQLFFRLAKSTTVIERLDLEDLAATRLAAVRLPSSYPVLPGGGGIRGFLLAAHGDGAHVTLHTPPLPPGTGLAVEHQGESSYRISVSDSDQELRVTFMGDVTLKPLTSPPVHLHLDHPDVLVLYPQSRALEIDVTFARFAPDSFAGDIAIDRLGLIRVIDQQTTKATELRKESTLLGGEVLVPATGRRTRLAQGETLRFAALSGSLTSLRLGKDGIRLGFQGRASGLGRVPQGLQPQSLMPSILDLWVAGPARVAVQAASGALALAVLLFTALEFTILSERK
jgi:hypothetical protein